MPAWRSTCTEGRPGDEADAGDTPAPLTFCDQQPTGGRCFPREALPPAVQGRGECLLGVCEGGTHFQGLQRPSRATGHTPHPATMPRADPNGMHAQRASGLSGHDDHDAAIDQHNHHDDHRQYLHHVDQHLHQLLRFPGANVRRGLPQRAGLRSLAWPELLHVRSRRAHLRHFRGADVRRHVP